VKAGKIISEMTQAVSAMLAAPNLMAAAITLEEVAHAQAAITLAAVALEAGAKKNYFH
jgi:hypothetical protein